jgi:hypothetical protein
MWDFFLYSGNRRGKVAGHFIEIRRGHVGQHSFSFSSLMAKVLALVNWVTNRAGLSASVSP